MNEIILPIGRLLFGGYFFWNGVKHIFTKRKVMVGYAASKGVALPGYAVPLSGALILLGGLGIVLGAYPTWSLIMIIAFLLPVTFTMHAYWSDADPGARMGDHVNFYKNLALVGAALMLLALPQPWPMALGW